MRPTILILGVNTHMATMQPQTNMNTGQQMTMTGMQATDTKHGGHELMDVHEVLSCTVSTLDQYLLFGQQAKDPELKNMITRQHQFILDTYNILAECFKSGYESISTYNKICNDSKQRCCVWLNSKSTEETKNECI